MWKAREGERIEHDAQTSGLRVREPVAMLASDVQKHIFAGQITSLFLQF